MTAYRDCPEARWFPSRYRFALPRLIAYVRSRFPTRPRTDVDHIMLTIDRDQTVGEQYPISVWMLTSGTCYVAAILPVRWTNSRAARTLGPIEPAANSESASAPGVVV